MRWGVRWWRYGKNEGWFYSAMTPTIPNARKPWTDDLNEAFLAMEVYQRQYSKPEYHFQVQEYL